MKKKNQTVIATEENVISFIKSDVYLFIDTLRQLAGDKKYKHEYEEAMRVLNAKFGDSISEELMAKVSKALEEHGIVDTEQEAKKEVKRLGDLLSKAEITRNKYQGRIQGAIKEALVLIELGTDIREFKKIIADVKI